MKYNIDMKKVMLICCLFVIGCASKSETQMIQDTPIPEETIVEEEMKQIELSIDDTIVEVAWEENKAVEELKTILEENNLHLSLSKYGGFEQVGPIGFDLPREDTQITTEPGDIVLYSGNQIVVFYGSNSWAYTKLGHIMNVSQEELTQLLGSHDVMVSLSLTEE